MVRIIATSDMHSELPDIPECDLLLICGDICPDGSVATQAKWLDTTYRHWLESVPAKEIVGIAGNHDFIFEAAEHRVPKGLKWHYLKDSMIELFGFKIYGTPWQLPFWGAFNLDEEQLSYQYANLPKAIDIFISHAPPFGILDEVPTHGDLIHTGSKTLRSKILEIKPQLFACGHIHCSSGVCKIGKTTFANVCLLNNQMEIANKPFIFNLT